MELERCAEVLRPEPCVELETSSIAPGAGVGLGAPRLP